ncbi:feline leukemia virus subgroup C receptor-related protein 2 isoform X3 [Cimex lectularius]|uniref:Major facilitator superfamily (MFS) profile domain-containing protein n=1 Tax=Cimex lectularius TaxID=79782 RepID=A0A8I6SMV9_CIMLE|nr:feline leukemia virus subgroup C receptor-related protein 2 isoform X3 [Cimex lectularius]
MPRFLGEGIFFRSGLLRPRLPRSDGRCHLPGVRAIGAGPSGGRVVRPGPSLERVQHRRLRQPGLPGFSEDCPKKLGVALGFLIPPSVVPDVDDNELVGSRLGLLFKSVAGFTSVLLVLIIFFYEEQPPLPPSQAALKQKEETPDFVGSIKRLLSNIGYILLLVSYGINVGVFYAISTLLNKVIITYFQNASEDAGRIGLTIVISGTVGSVVSGFVLDKTHKFKEVTLVVYLFSLIGLVVYNFTLDLGYIIIVYVTAGFLGFFMTGYLPVGFELAAELTYPEPEGTSVGILNGFCQIFGILFTIGYSALINAWGTKNAGLGLISTLAAGTVMTYFIPKDYKRQESGKDEKEPA